ncbi:hypothetical protein U8527_13965 [Kordia algicida OT-1]|uniref:Uncharacterized protein n=1 Tax=Kordia algicida OT-1 TaxID=391587 RepID=A9DXJ2_9FLAO|nr:hypothetical protein [Kordia algicida]EDP96010.1 hypothetical protein KAOT1_07573 [Kordia algicida OT-1]
MKKRSLKNLKLNKQSISDLNQMKGGNFEHESATIIPFCFTTLSCVLICVTKLGCDKE